LVCSTIFSFGLQDVKAIGMKLAGHSVTVEEGVVYVDGHKQIDAQA
jgi:hypothetical protein